MPVKKDGKEILKCNKCGFEKEVSDKEKKEYSVKANADKKNVKTTSLVSETSSRNLTDDLEQEREEYYKEVGLELLREEFEEGGDEDNGE